MEVDFLIRPHQGWVPQCNERHVRKTGAQTQCTTHLQYGRPNKKPIRKENVHTREHLAKRRAGGWIRTNFGLEVDFLIRPHQDRAPQRNANRVCKMGAQMQQKARPQVGHPNAMQRISGRWSPKRKTHPQRKRAHKGAQG